MKKTILYLLAMSICAVAENLIPAGDFTQAKENLSDIVVTNGGKAVLFTEDGNWNKCARLYVDKITRNDQGFDCVNSCAWVGRTTKEGVKVKPNTKYRFSVELRGNAASASVGGVTWDKGKDVWHQNKHKTTPVVITPEWKSFRGTFTTGPEVEYAAIQVSLWWNTQYGPMKFKLDDYVLIDNVILEEETNVLGAAQTPSIAPVPLRKAALAQKTPFVFNDFTQLNHHEVHSELTTVKISHNEQAFVLDIECDEPDKVVVAADTPWRGDCVEIFFLENGRIHQFVTSAGNATYTSDETSAWTHTAEASEYKWSLHVEIPYATIGLSPETGDSIPFNVARQRKNKKQLLTWSPLKDGFSDVKRFGELVIDDFSVAYQKAFGEPSEQPLDREKYEQAVADAKYAAIKAKYEKFNNLKFAVAPVPVCSDMAIPFVPEQIFNPVEKIEIAAAVNERKALPLAIANLTDKVAEYRVTIETVEPGQLGVNQYNGFYGLKGFPPDKIEQRYAIRYKDTDTDPDCLRLDPLPLMGQARTITIPPKEAGLVWFDFDTEDVAPGTYEGIIRVIPLSELGRFKKIGPSYHWRKYEGHMQDIPTKLTVRDIVLPKEPVIPMSFFQEAVNENMFKLMYDCGTREFGLSPWSFTFEKKDGKLDISPENWTESTLKIVNTIRRHQAWAKKFNSKIRFFIGYSSFHVVKQTCKPEHWEEWLHGLKAVMDSCGVSPQDYSIEVWDEPALSAFDEALDSLKRAKAAEPELQLCMTMGANNMAAELMAKWAPYVNVWILWSDGYFSRKDHLDFFAAEKAAGKRIQHYTCDTSMRSDLHKRYRRNAWNGARFQANGNNMYQFTDGMAGWGNSDWKSCATGSVSYRSFDEVLPSIRYMALREGMTDIKYLSLVQDQAFVEKAYNRVCRLNSHLISEPDAVREEAAQLIMKQK
ncbi:MAG: hypothetical protein IKP00_00555 [Victivallales bacterium]|nr:hypothetical protein [Victivallales bacterium]